MFENEIPYSLAAAAHAGTSFVPEQRARQEIAGFSAELTAAYEMLSKYATTEEKKATLAAEFERFRVGYRRRYCVYLGARSRCLSSMITGPSNFPTARNEKRNRSAHSKLEEMLEFKARAMKAIKKALTPELQPIMSGEANAVERLKAEIEKSEKVQERMKAANAAIRKHKKAGVEAQVAALVALGFHEAQARELLKPSCFGAIGFEGFELTNNGANIRRLKERLKRISAAKAAPVVEVEATESGIRYEENPGENRVRLFFPGKPEEAVRSALKANGFRWTPSMGCWQAYINPRTVEHAKRVAGVKETTNETT